MKLYEAKQIIEDVFENSFDKDQFQYFIRNLLCTGQKLIYFKN